MRLIDLLGKIRFSPLVPGDIDAVEIQQTRHEANIATEAKFRQLQACALARAYKIQDELNRQQEEKALPEKIKENDHANEFDI